MGKFVPDVDIDFANREEALKGLLSIPASMIQNGELRRHNVGVYFQAIPQDPLTGFSSLPYEEAEERGYFKLDFLNLNVYKDVRDEEHLNQLVARPPLWDLLYDKDICEQLFQLGGTIDGIPTYDLIEAYKPQTLDDLAIFLALLRPRKKHLIGREWDEIKAEIWQAGDDSLYGFKRAHALSYALVIVVQLNLLVEKANGSEPTV
jgi:hypothetical protein